MSNQKVMYFADFKLVHFFKKIFALTKTVELQKILIMMIRINITHL